MVNGRTTADKRNELQDSTYFTSWLSVAEAIMANNGWKIMLIGVSSDVVIMDRVTHSLYPAGR